MQNGTLTLRQQVEEIGARKINPEFVRAVTFPRLVDALAMYAFMDEWPRGADTAAVRRAGELLRSPGVVAEDEPAVGPPHDVL
jgi:hypothetical protein